VGTTTHHESESLSIADRGKPRAGHRTGLANLSRSGAGQFGNCVLFVKLSGDLPAMKRLAASAGAAATEPESRCRIGPTAAPTSRSPAPARDVRPSTAPYGVQPLGLAAA
jgi:hypothetical protein